MAIKPVRLVKNSNAAGPEYDNILCTSTAIDGDLLVRTNNTAVACASAATTISYFSQVAGTSTVPGLTTLALGKVRPGDTFEMNFFHTTSSLATVQDSDLDGTADYAITFATVSSVPAWFVDGTNTVNKSVRIVERLDSASTQYPRCRVQFLNTCASFA